MRIGTSETEACGFVSGICGQERTVYCGKELFRPVIYCLDPYDHRPWRECIRRMAEDGVNVISYLLPLTVAWDNPNGIMDFTLIDKLEDEILAIAPELLLMPRIFLTTPHWWDEKYPDELQKMEHVPFHFDNCSHDDQPLWKYEAKHYHDTQNASVASQQWLNDAGNALAQYIRHVMARHPGHLFCAHLAYGTCGEWGVFGTYQGGRFGNFDFSLPMVKAFREFLTDKYSDNEELRQAWRSETASLDSAMPPSKFEALSTDYYSLKDPRLHQKIVDWSQCFSVVQRKALQEFCRIVKKNAVVPVLTAAFGGALNQLGASIYRKHFHENRLNFMDIPELDVLCYPNWYVNRAKGVAAQGPTATIAKHKLFFAECDARGWIRNRKSDFYSDCFPKNDDEEYLSVARDTFFNMTTGQGLFWWYDFGDGWYASPRIRNLIQRVAAFQKRQKNRLTYAQPEIALVIDNSGNCFNEGDAGILRQVRTLLNERLPYAGYPLDVITLEALLDGTHRPYKLYYFRDEFHCTTENRRKIRRFLEESHASAVWFHAAGTISEEGIHPEEAQALTGIRIQAHSTLTSNAVTLLNEKHPLCQGMKIPCAFTDTSDIQSILGPIFSVTDENACILGQVESLELPGIAIRQATDRFDLWSESALFPVQLCANIAKTAGCTPCAPVGVTVSGAGSLRAFWSEKSVNCSIHWEDAPVVVDVISNEQFLTDRNQNFILPLKAGVPRLLAEFSDEA